MNSMFELIFTYRTDPFTSSAATAYGISSNYTTSINCGAFRVADYGGSCLP
jgi:hypothetical protein